MNHLIAYLELPAVPNLAEFDPSNWEEEITMGTGESYGFSTTFQKVAGKTTGQLNYAYTVSSRQFTDNNDGLSYPFRYTHPHEFKINLKHQFTKQLSFSANWIFGSGQPFTLVSTPYRYPPLSNFSDAAERVSSINGERLPAFHRLDIGFYLQWGKATIQQTLQLGAYNVYNRKNPYYQYLQEGAEFPEDNGLKQQNALPFLPSISYRIWFKGNSFAAIRGD